MVLNIAILGFGTVGRATYEILEEKKSEIEKIIKREIKLKKILVRDLQKYSSEKNFEIFTDKIEEIIADDEIELIIELTGEVDKMIEPMKTALSKRKNIITANKALVSKYMEELEEISKKYDSKIRYEAAVAGGIPIIYPLEKIVALNDVESIEGVLNGTCNFILSKMEEKKSYEEALKEAQRIGFAESDPTADVKGFDTMRKLRILSTIAFGKSVKEEEISLEGITEIKLPDIEKAAQKNMRYKLLASAKIEKGKIRASVKPTEISKDSIIGSLKGGENAVIIKASNVGELVFKGLGAGGRPTAFSVLSDFLNIYGNLPMSLLDALMGVKL